MKNFTFHISVMDSNLTNSFWNKTYTISAYSYDDSIQLLESIVEQDAADRGFDITYLDCWHFDGNVVMVPIIP